jgi:hypothetical protein
MNCPQCNNKATWINYGPTVGEGYYCRHCKDEVDHHTNSYGISGTRYKRNAEIKIETKPAIDRDGFIHMSQPFMQGATYNSQGVAPSATLPTHAQVPYYNGQDIQCIKHNCPNCGNKHAGTSVLNLKSGQFIYCKTSYGPLKAGNFYKFLNTEPNGIRVEVAIPGQQTQYLSYTACRFQV